MSFSEPEHSRIFAVSENYRAHASYLDLRAEPTRGLRRIYLGFRRALKRQLWSHPRLFWPAGLILQKRWLFDRNYDVLIDGFSRSANTYGSVALRLCYPHGVVICHRHMPVYVIQALRDRKPVCLLIREPRAAIASWIIYSGWDFDTAIDDYIAYYEPLMAYRDKLLVVEFNQVTREFPAVVQALNHKYGLNCIVPVQDDVFIERIYEGVRGFDWARNPMTISLPSPERKRLLEQVQVLLRRERFASQLLRAQQLYEFFTKPIVRVGVLASGLIVSGLESNL